MSEIIGKSVGWVEERRREQTDAGLPFLNPTYSEIGNCRVREYEGLRCFSLSDFPALHGFFARKGGVSEPPYASLNTAYISKDPHAPVNRKLLFEKVGIDNRPVRILNPCHGDKIVFEDNAGWERQPQDVLIQTDAAFTRTPGTYFLVSTADCIAAVFTDTSLSFTGVVHLGWRNLLAGFTGKVIAALQSQYGMRADDLLVGIGPMIYPCCYVFKDPVQKNESFWQPFLRNRGNGNYAIDLVSAFKAQLNGYGVPDEHISETGICTSCQNHLFFSCYREGYFSGRFPTLVGLKAA